MIQTIDLGFHFADTIASYVLETDEGLVMVECGPHSTFANLEFGLKKLGYQAGDVKHLFLTHIHFDHAGAAWAFAKLGATVYVHPRGWKHLQDPTRLYNSAKRIYGDMMEKLWGEMHGIEASRLKAVEDQEVIQIGDKQFIAWHTPGHASHHIAWQLGDVVFTGDVAGCKILDGLVVPPCPPPDINLELWLDSIGKLRKMNPRVMYLTHFGPVTEINTHLDQLAEILSDWANWIKPHWEAGRSPEDVTAEFQAYADEQLRKTGVGEDIVERYNAANPAWMSVAGLMRYWQKKAEAEAAE